MNPSDLVRIRIALQDVQQCAGSQVEGEPTVRYRARAATEACGTASRNRAIELEHLGERIEPPGDDPIMCSGIFGGIQEKERQHRKRGKKLYPEVEPQVVRPAPQQQAEHADGERRPK